MTIHKVLHARDNIDRLYVSRKEYGRGLTSIENCVDATIQRVEEYTKKSKEKLSTAASNSNVNIRRSSELDSHQQMQLNFIPRTLLLG